MPKTLPAVLALCALSVAAMGGCRRGGDEPAPEAPATVAQDPAQEPAASAHESSSAETMPLVRKAVRDYVTERFPGAQVEGLWVVSLRNNYCFAAADVSSGSRRRVVEVLARLFVRENGSEYWRADGIYGDSAAARLLPRDLGHSSGEEMALDEEN